MNKRISAFPYQHKKEHGAFTLESEKGLTLRDYFAGQAIIGLLSQAERNPRLSADHAFLIADEMIKAREIK